MNTIYLDMDGVLADFDSKTLELISRTHKDYDNPHQFWSDLGEYKDNIYLTLELMPDASELVSYILSHAVDHMVGVLTGVPKIGKVGKAKLHKQMWLRQHFPALLVDFNIGPWAEDKYKHCTPGDILIDDSIRNIEQWNAVGGIGILHRNAKFTISQLKNVGIV